MPGSKNRKYRGEPVDYHEKYFHFHRFMSLSPASASCRSTRRASTSPPAQCIPNPKRVSRLTTVSARTDTTMPPAPSFICPTCRSSYLSTSTPLRRFKGPSICSNPAVPPIVHRNLYPLGSGAAAPGIWTYQGIQSCLGFGRHRSASYPEERFITPACCQAGVLPW